MVCLSIIIYLVVGFLLVKPKDKNSFHWDYVDISQGLFMAAIPTWLWLICLVFWLPIAVIIKIKSLCDNYKI